VNILGPTRSNRLNEAAAVVLLLAALFLALSLVSYHALDPSWDVVSGANKPQNLTGFAGSYLSDFCLQMLGFAAFSLPVFACLLAWRWFRSAPIDSAGIKLTGCLMLVLASCTALSMPGEWRPWSGAFPAGGLIGALISESLKTSLNVAGTVIVTVACLVVSLYLISTFSMAKLTKWLAGPQRWFEQLLHRWEIWREKQRAIALARAQTRAEKRAAAELEKAAKQAQKTKKKRKASEPEVIAAEETPAEDGSGSFEQEAAAPEPEHYEIPIHALDPEAEPEPLRPVLIEPAPVLEFSRRDRWEAASEEKLQPEYHVPPTDLLNEVPARNPYDSIELKEIAARIKSKFEEFNVHGSVVQINPGPVVTTFEFKPEAGIKYSRITTLTEDLCLGLQAESILIERIPGKPTVGIEVPNSKREVISLRQILESDEFQNSPSKMTICLGKDISGRIKVAALESMPHLLIAGSTGSGKSVMLNSLIMSVLYKATPDEVRMIMVDPKRLELGLYEGIPHLLTPVITDAKKATNALRNAVLEMERRLKLLASRGVRNIDQYNRKVRQLAAEPRSLFEDEPVPEEDLKPLPYILIIIDELADLMMVERGGVEEAVTRLAQMARAIGMHLVLATQRPSVDVITGLIKANFPSRISFRVATRVDSRTVLDVMGAEHLLGKGDMLFLPPGSSRLTRVHGAFVTETEINRVVEFWKEQAPPEYDQTFLLAPPAEEAEDSEAEIEGEEDPMYHDAVRVVLEMGKASTSTLQRRLRLGYGRAARILDMMQREGIIGPPDGSKPRDVLKRPDWLEEVENQLR